MTDDELAHFLADEAGRMLLVLQQSASLSDRELGDEGDRIANDFLLGMLRMKRPSDAILSEEEKDGAERLSSHRVWIVDPLDGTREYSEGRSDWAVHVGLAVDGIAVAGAVALPGSANTISTATPLLIGPRQGQLRMVVSRSRPAAEAIKVADLLGAQTVQMGSAGVKAMAVVQGDADIYLHTGGQYEWDNCAPVAIASAAGLHVSRVDGLAMRYNNANPYLPDLLICRKELAEGVFAALNA